MGLEMLQDGEQKPRKRGTALTASQQVVADANRVECEEYHTDRCRHTVGVRRSKGGDSVRLARILNAEDGAKPAVVSLSMLAFCVCEIDGEAVARPLTSAAIDVILDRLGDEGIQAATAAYMRFRQNDAETTAKNSLTTHVSA